MPCVNVPSQAHVSVRVCPCRLLLAPAPNHKCCSSHVHEQGEARQPARQPPIVHDVPVLVTGRLGVPKCYTPYCPSVGWLSEPQPFASDSGTTQGTRDRMLLLLTDRSRAGHEGRPQMQRTKEGFQALSCHPTPSPHCGPPAVPVCRAKRCNGIVECALAPMPAHS